MRSYFVLSFVLFSMLPSLILNAAEESQQKLAQTLQKRISDYHAGAEDNGETLRLIYFHAGDTGPQADYKARVERIVLDVQEFYDTEMNKLGFSTKKLPLEREKGKLKIHLVKGEDKLDNYSYENGTKVKRELVKALQGKVDFDNDYILVICGLCKKLDKNYFLFNSPYYGSGSSNHRAGLCYAADCEILDPKNLTDTKTKMRYDEHSGKYSKTFANFNTAYLGGIAHELGHGLSLPHNGELPAQRINGNALMGGGNLTYRNDVWGGGRGSFMTLPSGLRLAAHPLFTGSDRGRNEQLKTQFTGLKFSTTKQGLSISGSLESNVETLAVIAYTDPPGRSGYNANTWVAEVMDGKFKLLANYHRPGDYSLRLTTVHANGATKTMEFSYQVDKAGTPDADLLTSAWVVRPIEALYLQGNKRLAVEQAKAALKENPAEATASKLEHIVTLNEPKDLVDLSKTISKRVSLSDATWEEAQIGWGEPARDQYFNNRWIKQILLLDLGGKFYAKGLYAHAPSNYTFNLDGKWKEFQATVGLQAGAQGKGTSIFIVKGDGKELYRTKLLKDLKTDTIKVSVQGVKKLELIAESGVEGNAVCWSIWGAPEVSR